MTPIWRFFGADEPNYAYMKDGKKLLSELGQLGKPQVYFRAHHLLTSGDGAYALKWGSTSAYKEDADGKPVYDWTINDRIFDTYLERGIKPYVEIGFMPEALSTHPQNYPHNPPVEQTRPVEGGPVLSAKGLRKWGELVYQWAKHCVEKYGKAEVDKWYWEVWNEPNICYWHGSRAEYFKLYDYAVDGVRRALPTARVGGPETAGGAEISARVSQPLRARQELRDRENRLAARLYLLSCQGLAGFHERPCSHGHGESVQRTSTTGLRSSPRFLNSRRRRSSSANPIPKAARRAMGRRTAIATARCIRVIPPRAFRANLNSPTKYGVNLEGALTWAFEFENQPPFAGFRQLASNGIDLPVLNVFRMFGKMSGRAPCRGEQRRT